MDKNRLIAAQRDKLLFQVHQAVLGVPNTDDNGLRGDIKEIKKHLRELNGQVRTNTVFRKICTWLSAAIVAGLISLAVRLFGN